MPIDIDFPPVPLVSSTPHEMLGACGDPRQPLLVWAAHLDRDVQIEPRTLDRALLAFSFDGMMRVEIGEDHWFIPDRHGIWITPGDRHLLLTVSPIELQAFYIHPRQAILASMPKQPTVVRATPLMRGIARRLAPSAVDALSRPERRRLAWVALDEMARLERSDLRLPGGRDPRVTAAVTHLLARPQEARSLARLADRIGTSERSLSRLFRTETGLSWQEWRDRMRFMLALEGLQEGMSSTALAARLGYSNPSAFVAAFRRRAGMPPSEWRKGT
ncbi:helix-turn-helix transcriptional regulator [Aquicoccus sp. SU-CL01552]|uniref:helix-turn-helix domain-containing protein n=1 Tax=Aquicoccus sp. SU-CL01552 TaxID=3127656 RepID=UPI0033410ECE